MGRQIYLSDKEIQALRDVSIDWVSIMEDGEESSDNAEEKLHNGLGSALYKLFKGCNGERLYRKYIT